MVYSEESYEARHERRFDRARRKKGVLIGVLIGVVIAVVVAFLTFGRFVSAYRASGGDAPLIKADRSPVKVRPATPGGMEVPNQDKLIYERLRESDAARVEKLMPAPEKPALPEDEEDASDEIAQIIALEEPQETPQSLEVASTTLVVEDGERVEVMFRTISSEQAQNRVEQAKKTIEAQKAQAAAVLKSSAPAKQKPAPAKSAPEKPAAKPEAKKAAPEKPVAKPEAKKNASAETFAVQLVSTKNRDASEKEWTRLSKKHADALKGLPHEISEIKTDKNTFYRLRTGVFDSRDKADAVCRKLKDKKQECLVVKR